MLNPILSNFRIDFSEDFFPENIIKKYNDYLFYKNAPFKNINDYLYESIQQLNTPGINLQTMTADNLQNLGNNPSINNFPNPTVNRTYAGTSNLNEILESNTVNITFRNSIINWMYCYEILYSYYKRTRSISDFGITLTMLDSSEIEIIRFKFKDCFVAGLPGLEFAYNQSFSETKTFDVTFAFNKFDLDFILPDFNVKPINLKQ